MTNDTAPNENTRAPGDDGACAESLCLVGQQELCGDGPGAGGHAPAADGGDEESSFLGYVMVPLDSGLQISYKNDEQGALDFLRCLIQEYGHQRAVAGTGDGVRAAWADINDELKNNWRLK